MNVKKRMVFGIIAAEVYKIAQRELLMGIIEQANKNGIDTAVISNIYNENCCDRELDFENIIYDLILSNKFDGLIMLSEPFSCEKLRKKIHEYLLKNSDIPIVIAGSSLTDFEIPNARLINTSDEKDMEDAVNHLIDEHGFTDIDLLTGYASIEVSHLRVKGYRNALQKHSIHFDERKVIYGDFWINSGQKLACEYIDGQRPWPQAVICSNDYMAFGLLDEFAERNIDVPNRLTVTGFDLSMERHNHTPLLTSYKRNWRQLGRDAVQILYEKITRNMDINFQPPKGNFVHGISCGCSVTKLKINDELKNLRIKSQYEQWSLLGNMEQKLTESRTLDEFIAAVGEYQFLVRFVQNIYICLYDDWYEYKSDLKSNQLTCRSIMPWLDTLKFSLSKNNLTDIFLYSENPAAYYFAPLVFKKRHFGYVVLKYDAPDSYDDVFRNWIKSVTNGLEFIRMKNDIRYLTQCHNLSATRDSLTALYNKNGLENARISLNESSSSDKKCYFVLLNVCLNSDEFADIDKNKKISSIIDVAEAVRQFSSNYESACGRTNDSFFSCYIKTSSASADFLTDSLKSILMQHKVYMENYGMDSFVCLAFECIGSQTYQDINDLCMKAYMQQIEFIRQKKLNNHYKKMLEIRNYIYLHPKEKFSTEEICKRYSFSPGYLRVTYKKCFGISFYQDCINCHISMAKALLCTTNLSIGEISEKCGYNDSKYFLRQFLSNTGVTPNQYRSRME